jgi:integrase/recombinase XerD
MISQYIQLQKATHRGKEIVLFKFWNREDWKNIIKKSPHVKFSRTLSAYYIPYNGEAYASFKKVDIPHKYPSQIDTTESLPSNRAVVDIEPNSSSNVNSLLGNDVGDTSISDSHKTELEIIWNAKGFSIQLPYNNDAISFIRKLEKSWWNNKVKLWYLKSSIHNLDAIQKRWTYFDKETYARLFLESIENTKHLCIVYMLYGSGLRAGEVLNLQLADIYWDRKQVHVKGAKGKKDRVVSISQKLIDRMAAYFDVYQPVRYLFEGSKKGKNYSYSSMRQIIQRAKGKANITKQVTAHVMRHSFATHNMDAGVPLPYIQRMLGHKDIKTTMIYMHITKNTFDSFESPLDNL